MTRIAFYAPLKPPDHPIPSGDREIARLIIKALSLGGFEVELASRYICYQKRPGAELFEARRAGAIDEAERLIAHYKSAEPHQRPDAWFTYHTYWKAPDSIGPRVSKALGIPYFTAEACRTGQNEPQDWAAGRAIVEAGMHQAAANFCLKSSDRDYLETVLKDTGSIVPLKPFIDTSPFEAERGLAAEKPFANDDPVILAVGMMRPGKKAECYRILADALDRVSSDKWNLLLVGDGPERENIESWFSFVAPDRIRFCGTVTPKEVRGLMRASDLFAWPGYREPIGMVYLEAQATGLPVAALDSLGVSQVVGNHETGLLAAEDDIAGYAAILEKLITDPQLRERLGAAGPARVARLNSLEAAAQVLAETIASCLKEPASND
ncbi:glycosyltransferase family 4 protein [Rhizobium sp. L1K21]|uniref:glycosyltransferase family 4 protein n=1 Tax=Rhizobium sp. L1K21 TaxID=2954933 RepID=UPI0020922D88|nr:glycosyltransferase family 4 protein [Rhizobium sp. L1K21]MCO6187651.1 glycosyltransferase family 4 protein [Rhizobium sp. L1K21]